MTLRRPLALSLGLLPLLLAGCYYPGGSGSSEDRFTYESDSWKPWTITLVDTRTGQAFWAHEIPVGRELVFDFVEGEGTDDNFTPDLMLWEEFPAGQRYGSLSNSIPVPGPGCRRIDSKLRPVPELPPEMLAARNEAAAAPAPAPGATPPAESGTTNKQP